MALVDFAKKELAGLRSSGAPDGDDRSDAMQDAIERDIIEIIERFAAQGHSGSSASYAISCLERLLRYEPLTPLRGTDDEWNEVGEQNGGPLYQNNRCSRVFKDPTGAYDIYGKVFREPNGACFTSRDSRVAVTFPYTPTTIFVDRAAA